MATRKAVSDWKTVDDWQTVDDGDWKTVDLQEEKPPSTAIAAPPTWANKLRIMSPQGRLALDLAEGITSGAASTLFHGGDLVRRALGMERVIDRPEVQQAITAPPSIAGKMGKGMEQIGEFLLPAGIVGKGTKAATAALGGSKAASLGTAMAAGGLTGAGMAGLQTGGDPEAMKTAAITGVIAPAAIEAVKPVAKVAVKALTDLWGKTTGVGGEAIRRGAGGDAIQVMSTAAAKKFKDALKNRVTETEIVDDLKGAVKDLASKRAANYESSLSQIDQSVQVPIQEARAEIAAQLPKFRIKGARTGLDFSTSTLTPNDQGHVTNAIQDAMAWNDFTPAGMDALKRRLYNYAEEAGPEGSAFIYRVAGKVKDALNKSVPGYQQMSKDYEEASKFLKSVQKEFSTTSENPGQIIRKLSTSLNQNNQYRKMLLEAIDENGHDLIPSIAGSSMSQYAPRGLAGALGGAGAGGMLAMKGGIAAVPGALGGAVAAAPVFSPRVAGEILALISTLRRAVPAPPSTAVSPVVTGTVSQGQQMTATPQIQMPPR